MRETANKKEIAQKAAQKKRYARADISPENAQKCAQKRVLQHDNARAGMLNVEKC